MYSVLVRNVTYARIMKRDDITTITSLTIIYVLTSRGTRGNV